MPKGLPLILDRPIPKGKSEVSLSAFAFLFSAIVQYTKSSPTPARSLTTWEERLHAIGYGVGIRVLDLIVFRTKGVDSRETDLIRFLTWIQTTVWKAMFNKQAELKKVSQDGGAVFLICDPDPIVSHYVCNPPDYSKSFSSEAYLAGFLAGLLDGAEFPAEVTAHNYDPDGTGSREINCEINFKRHVLQRAERVAK
ncbi:Trafficking protein particle complex subunit 5 [Diplonema papillatum]|nr:Trafficking protein particle complex subunit 5 [Diplonema papillatum]